MSGTANLETDAQRIVRLEEQVAAVRQQIGELREEQRQHAETIARAVGGVKMLAILSALGGAVTLLRTTSWWLAHSNGGPH